MSKIRPIKIFYHPYWGGGVHLSVWKSERGDGYSFRIKKNYKLKDKKTYKETKVFFPQDLASLSFLINSAMEWMMTQETYKKLPPIDYGFEEEEEDEELKN